MSAPVTLRRYLLPSINGEGWAEIVIGSNGFFAAVSDFGDYAHAWRNHGEDDFRKFLLNAPRNWDYFARKLGTREQAHEFDGDETSRGVKRYIIAERRAGRISKERARKEWDLLAECDNLYSQYDFWNWHDDTRISNAGEFATYRINRVLERFCRETLARLDEVIRAELAAEASAPAKDAP